MSSSVKALPEEDQHNAKYIKDVYMEAWVKLLMLKSKYQASRKGSANKNTNIDLRNTSISYHGAVKSQKDIDNPDLFYYVNDD